MHKVYQTLFGEHSGTPTTGNCFPACLASIMDLELRQVPNFYAQSSKEEIEGRNFQPTNLRLREWIRSRGWRLIGYEWPMNQASHDYLAGALAIFSGKSPRGNYAHAVVGRIGASSGEWIPVHDPRRASDGKPEFLGDDPFMIELVFQVPGEDHVLEPDEDFSAQHVPTDTVTPSKVTLRPLEWSELDKNEWVEGNFGFYINLDNDEPKPYCATWGEEAPEYYATLDEAKAWCHDELTRWISSVVDVVPPKKAGTRSDDPDDGECPRCGAPTDPDYGHVRQCTSPAETREAVAEQVESLAAMLCDDFKGPLEVRYDDRCQAGKDRWREEARRILRSFGSPPATPSPPETRP